MYKNCILTLLFVKYVTDKFRDDPYGEVEVPEDGNFDTFKAARNHKNIGEMMDVALQALAKHLAEMGYAAERARPAGMAGGAAIDNTRIIAEG